MFDLQSARNVTAGKFDEFLHLLSVFIAQELSAA
jgi:hypothetical protein